MEACLEEPYAVAGFLNLAEYIFSEDTERSKNITFTECQSLSRHFAILIL